MHTNHEDPALTKAVTPERYSDGSSASSDDESCSQIESWSSSHSSSCSSCSDSETENRSAEWEAEIRQDGQLYYIESDPQVKYVNDSDGGSISGVADACTRAEKEPSPKSWKSGGKLIRLIRRRESKRHHGKMPKSHTDTGRMNKQSQDLPIQQASCQPSDVSKENPVHIVELYVDPWVKQNLGRRATLSETLLGLVTVIDESAVIVTDFVPDGPAAKQSSIKIGERICSINGKSVTPHNFISSLEAINVPTALYIGVCENPKLLIKKNTNSSRKSPKSFYQTSLAERISRYPCNSSEIEKLLLLSSVGVLYLHLDGLTEGGPEDQGVVYCYPGNFKTNILGSVRGAFLTLFQLIPDISHSTPKSSSILVSNQLVHVIYVQEGREMLLIALPTNRCSLTEAENQCMELVRFLQFSYQSLSRCFSFQERCNEINHHISIFLSRLLLADKWAEVSDVTSFQSSTWASSALPQFEQILPAAHVLPLPREAQIQIDDALSELESNDIGDSCEDLDCQRLYTILGCCLYHKGYLLASHLTHSDLQDVHAFCRQQGLLQLIHSESVRSLVIWKEVFPMSVSRGKESDLLAACCLPEGRWFLMIVGQKQDLLVTLLEAGGCSLSADGNPPPDVFYVEAAQDTLQHLQRIGVPSIANEWLETQLRPKVATPEAVAALRGSNRKVNLLGLRIHPEPGWQSSLSSIINSPPTRKSTDSLATGKRRHSPDHSSSGPLHGGETSEDSTSLVASLPSDDTGFFQGKGRSDRDQATHISQSDQEASEDSDSDWELSDTQTGRRHTSTTDLSDLHNSLLKNVEGTVPSKLSMGTENIVFHYVHIETSEGILLSPVHSSHSSSFVEILSKFRLSAMHIHSLFQNTVSFKRLKGAEAGHSLINKSLVAIKEFGILFEYHLPQRGNEKNAPPLTYWVVGRLFFMPMPREVYVCYEDSAPQNLVELAFRLALTTTG